MDGTRQTVEVNLFDFDEEIYGQTLRVEVVRHLRGEKKFDGLESLKQQLARDRENALQVLQFPKD